MKNISKILILLLVVGCIRLFADDQVPAMKFLVTGTGERYGILTCNEKYAPTYYVFTHQDESKKLLETLIVAIGSKANIVLLSPSGEQNSIGAFIKEFEAVDLDVRSKFEVHPQRVYGCGFRNGATIAMAVSKWLRSKMKGVLLVNGYHWPVSGHPILQSDVYSFGHTEGRELDSLTKLKEKHATYPIEFIVKNFDKGKEVPSVEEILEGYQFFETTWVEKYDGITDQDRKNRFDRFNVLYNELKASAKSEDKRYLALVNLHKKFLNTTDPSLKNQIKNLQNELDSLRANSELIKTYESYMSAIELFESQEKDFENVKAFCELSETYSKRFANSIIAEMADANVKKWKQYSLDRRLDIKKVDAKSVVDGFMRDVQTKHPADSQTFKMVKALYDNSAFANTLEDYIPNALMLLDANFQKALVEFSTNELRKAYKRLEEMQSDSFYVMAYRLYYMARINFILERYELSEVQWQEFLKAYSVATTHQGEAFFNLAFCKYKSLQYKEARVLLEEFMARYPESGERLRVAAYQLIEKIDSFEDGSLQDVEEKMAYSQRKIRHGDLEEDTKKQQKEIVKLLDKLIEQEEQQEQENRDRRKSEQSQGRGDGGNEPADDSTLPPEGETKIGDLKKFNKGDEKDSWGKLRDKEREKVYNEMKKDLPVEYKGLIEQYFKKLQDGN